MTPSGGRTRYHRWHAPRVLPRAQTTRLTSRTQRRSAGGGCSRAAAGPEAGRDSPLGGTGRAVGADALAHRLPVRPQPVELRGGRRRVAGGLPGEGRAGDGPAVASVVGRGQQERAGVAGRFETE